jgi:hypothetical protein
MPRTTKARWWRISVRYRGRLVEDRRFDPNARVTVGEGGTSIVLPGVEQGVLVGEGRLRAVPGLELRGIDEDGTHELVPSAAPDVALQARHEECDRPVFASNFQLPWRELAYGLAVMGCVAGLLLVQQIAAASPSGGPAPISARMERAMFVELDTPTPTIARFAPPTQPTADVEEPDTPEPKADDDEPEPTVVAIDEPAPVVTVRPKPAKRRRAKPRPLAEPSGEHSHASEGQPEPGGGPGDAVATANTCDDPRREPKDNVDVVFVIDVSTTMAFALDNLADEIVALDASVRRHDTERRYGLVLFVDDVLVVDGNPYTDIDALRRDFRHWARFTSSNRQLHSGEQNLDWPENGLDALTTAATKFDWRDADDTLRLVVYASDDDFGESGAVQSGQRVRHDYTDTVEALRDASIRVASFTAPIGGQCECDDVRAGFMAPYRGRRAIPVATGGASFDIDEVAAGRLHFDRALSGLVDNLVCDD